MKGTKGDKAKTQALIIKACWDNIVSIGTLSDLIEIKRNRCLSLCGALIQKGILEKVQYKRPFSYVVTKEYRDKYNFNDNHTQNARLNLRFKQ